MSFTPNRRKQSNTKADGDNDRLQLAFVLAVGGHSDSHYNYGPGGSINGLMAVWDSWAENFFTQTANTTSLILLFDERDYLKQNITTSKREYLDTIMMKNMGAEPVDCIHMRSLPSHSIETVVESMYYHAAHTGKKHTGNYYPAAHHHTRAGGGRRLTKQHGVGHGKEHNGGGAGAGAGTGPGGHGHVSHSSTHGGGGNHAGGYSNTNHDAAMLSGHAPLGCKNELPLDQHYYVYFYTPTTATTASAASTGTGEVQPVIIFAAVHNFPKPDWAKEQKEDDLFVKWRPNRLNKRYPTNYGYVKMTNWYAYHMLQLQLLDYFDYAGKLDNDVSFVRPFPRYNLPQLLANGGHWMLTSANGWYHDDPRISQGVELCIAKYLEQESGYCNDIAMRLASGMPTGSASAAVDRYVSSLLTTASTATTSAATDAEHTDTDKIFNRLTSLRNLTQTPTADSNAADDALASYLLTFDRTTLQQVEQNRNKKNPPSLITMIPRGGNDTTFFDGNFNTTFRAHFLVYWLGLYTAPEVKQFAKYWNDFHPWGMWDFRWGDQQWWPRPIAIYGHGNLPQEIFHYDEINTDNQQYVVHKEWPRWGTIPKVSYYNPVNGTTRKERETLYQQAAKKFIY